MSESFKQPVRIIALFNSSLRISRTLSMPAYPLYAIPQSTGQPINTVFAPRAKAFKTSVPLSTPPSKYTSIFPSTALTHSSSTSIEAGVVSSYQAPWFDTQMASAPISTAHLASSAHWIPFKMIGSLVICQISLILSNVKELSLNELTNSLMADSPLLFFIKLSFDKYFL